MYINLNYQQQIKPPTSEYGPLAVRGRNAWSAAKIEDMILNLSLSWLNLTTEWAGMALPLINIPAQKSKSSSEIDY